MANAAEDPSEFLRRLMKFSGTCGVDFTAYLSDCSENDIDPRAKIRLDACCECWGVFDRGISKQSLERLLHCFEGGSCNDSKKSRRTIRLYDLAAEAGQLEVLHELPSHYNDIDRNWKIPSPSSHNLETEFSSGSYSHWKNPSPNSNDLDPDPNREIPSRPNSPMVDQTLTQKYCFHGNERNCRARRDIVRSALQLYMKKNFPVQKIIGAFKCQPCSEDILEYISLLPKKILNTSDTNQKGGTDVAKMDTAISEGQEGSSELCASSGNCDRPREQKLDEDVMLAQCHPTLEQDIFSQHEDCNKSDQHRYLDPASNRAEKRGSTLDLGTFAQGSRDFTLRDEAKLQEDMRKRPPEQETFVSDDFTIFVNEFADVRGAHTGKTLLLQACADAREDLVPTLLRNPRTDIQAKTEQGKTALKLMTDHLYNYEAKKRIMLLLKRHGYERWPDLQPVESEENDLTASTRKMQTRLCQLAWKPFDSIQDELRQCNSVLFEPVCIKFCRYECRMDLFPYVDPIGYPPIIFCRNFDENRDLFRVMELGECACVQASRGTTYFLPACAAIAAGNVELFQYLMDCLFESKFQCAKQQFGKGEGKTAGDGDRLKPCIRPAGATGPSQRKTRRRVEVTETRTIHHKGALVAEVIRHALFAGHAQIALDTYDKAIQKLGLEMTGDDKVSLLDMALRMGDESIFLQFVHRFGLNVRCLSSGLTPLLLAVRFSRVNLAEKLLQEGAARNLTDARDRNSIELALQLQTPDADLTTIRLLMNGEGRTDPQNPRIPSSLQTAIERCRVRVVDYLVDVLGETHIPVGTRGSLKQNPAVHWAPVVAWCIFKGLEGSSLKIGRHLVEKGMDWRSPLPAAVQGRFIEWDMPVVHMLAGMTSDEALGILKLLIQKGADVNSGQRLCADLSSRQRLSDVVIPTQNAGALNPELSAGSSDQTTRTAPSAHSAAVLPSQTAAITTSSTQDTAGEVPAEDTNAAPSLHSAGLVVSFYNTEQSDTAAVVQNMNNTPSTQTSGVSNTCPVDGAVPVQNAAATAPAQNNDMLTVSTTHAHTQNNSIQTSGQTAGALASTQTSGETDPIQSAGIPTRAQSTNGRNIPHVPTTAEEDADEGDTPLVLAMKKNNRAAIGMLLLAGAKLDTLGNQRTERSFLHQAVSKKNAAMIRLALQAGYRAHLERWFTDSSLRDGLPQDCQEALNSYDPLSLPLTFRCRKVLRDKLGGALPHFVETSGLPNMLKDFILMKDLIDAYGAK